MSAQGFENYGYTAPTLSDSSSDGIFWSKYIVVAHTQEDDIYFVSEVDSGYSVDNIAPVAPEAFSTEFDSGILSTTWRMILTLIYSIMRFLRMEISILKQLKSNSYDGFDLGVTRTFKVRGVDVNDNVGEFSDPFLATYGLKGDITWDGIIDILDVTKIIYHILFPMKTSQQKSPGRETIMKIYKLMWSMSRRLLTLFLAECYRIGKPRRSNCCSFEWSSINLIFRKTYNWYPNQIERKYISFELY